MAAQNRKTEQLQIRVSAAEKAVIKHRASYAGMSMSDWVLSLVLPVSKDKFQRLLNELSRSQTPGFVVAELNELLSQLSVDEYRAAVADQPQAQLDEYWLNYVAAMVEHAAVAKRADTPTWTKSVRPLTRPVFGSSLKSLRLHLLSNGLPAFRSRNIFIDSSVGDRV